MSSFLPPWAKRLLLKLKKLHAPKYRLRAIFTLDYVQWSRDFGKIGLSDRYIWTVMGCDWMKGAVSQLKF